MKEQKKQGTAKKKRGTLMFPIFLCVFVGGYLFFFTSNFWMPNHGSAKRETSLGTEITWNDRKVKVLRWEYSEEQKMMEVELSISNDKFDRVNTYKFSAKTSDGKILSVDPVIEDADWVIVRIKDVPKRFSEISLRMEIPDNADAGMAKMYTNTKAVSRVTTIEDKSKNGYLAARYRAEVADYREQIETLSQKISDNEDEMVSIQLEIRKMEDEKEYQTEEEISQTDSKISQAESNISSLEGKNEELEKQITEYSDRIDNLNEKLDDIPQK